MHSRSHCGEIRILYIEYCSKMCLYVVSGFEFKQFDFDITYWLLFNVPYPSKNTTLSHKCNLVRHFYRANVD